MTNQEKAESCGKLVRAGLVAISDPTAAEWAANLPRGVVAILPQCWVEQRNGVVENAHLAGHWGRLALEAQAIYVSTYCNFAHRIKTGRPIDHECRIIPPAAVRAEMDDDYETAIEIMQAIPAVVVRGRG